jgi:hypothetical protein
MGDNIEVEEKEAESKEERRNFLGLQVELKKSKLLSNSKYRH